MSISLTLKAPYKPEHSENRMKHEGDVERARKYFFREAPQNLKMLIAKRFEWMNDWIQPGDKGIEVGAGAGLSKEFIRCPGYEITDFADKPWLDHKNIDALATGFKDESFDFVVSSNMIHHVPYPMRFFEEMYRILKPGGLVLIQEINASFFMRLALRLTRHEGYSFTTNVFDRDEIATDANDLWSANCAIPNLLFDDRKHFEEKIPSFKIEHTGFDEFTCFLNSGGVIAKTRYLPLPRWGVRMLQVCDKALANLLPSVFALQRQIVLRKNGTS